MNPPDSGVLRIGAVRVDPALDEICLDGTVIKLEPRTMRLLMCLARHAGQVVSVEQLLDEVWNDVVVNPDSVYQAVAMLRRVLHDDAKDPTYIANVLRRGYRLVAPVAPWIDAPAVSEANAPATPAPVDTALPVAATASAFRWLGISLIVALSLALAYLAVDKLWLKKRSAVNDTAVVASTPVGDNSIAVLAFADMSQNKDQEYFSDGLSEELLNLLAKLPELRVAARTSAFSFKGKSDDIPTIAAKLHVANVLEGSVRKSGHHLRVTAQLIRADTGYHLWSETYDRELDDVFEVQDEIASAVVKALKVTLLSGEAPHAAATKSTQAYTLLLLARFTDYQLWSKEGEQKAVDYYEQVVQLDPTSAAGWEGLSRAVAELPRFGVMPWQQARDRARHAAEQALAIDPKLPAAHIALGKVRYFFDLDWPAAQTEFAAARALDPRDAYALLWAGLVAGTVGRSGDALQIFQEGISQDPLNYYLHSRIAAATYNLGRFAESEAAARRAVELLPAASQGHVLLAQALLALGKRETALAEIERESYEGLREYGRARTYWLLGQKANSDAALTRLKAGFSQNLAYNIAAVHALRGEPDQALQWLERAYQQREMFLIFDGGLVADPDFNSLRNDGRYKSFLRKMKLPG
ncbi:MAG TPA: winged helix-turn-helix domain-containing protein [Steroidobacteraceae bacterium]|jgi:TolB-like protein/DNA-binding winged helix-turn-helix (wHTH) protein|nr:winged helix-turn-helix domain-containing protein [Steroidobacteraceae bacterium]